MCLFLDILQAAADEGIISKKFISIVDKDSGGVINNHEKKEFSWDVYHIENYLLVEKYLYKVIYDLGYINSEINSEEKISNKLKEYANETLNFHVRHELYIFVNTELQNSIRLRIDDKKPLNEEYFNRIEDTIKEIELKKENDLSEIGLSKKEEMIRIKYENSLKDESWKFIFNGRNILKNFVNQNCKGIHYERFRNLLIAKMKDDNFL